MSDFDRINGKIRAVGVQPFREDRAPANHGIRVYPADCASAHCGRVRCDGCPKLPALEAFKAWAARTAARVTDPVWCPNVYTATKADPEAT